MATNKYIGSRYVPKYFGTWSSATEYEALSIVSDAQGEYTYTSKRPVPAGTLLSNVEYWAPSGRLSESMEIGVISHVDSTKADNATIAANKLNITFASDYTMNDSTKASINLNTTVQSGTYGINPSLCQNVPDDLKLSADTAQLFVYVVGANTYTQTLVSPKAGGYYVRISVNDQWSDWVSVGGSTVTYATKANAGLVQLGDGLKSENATGLTSIDHDATLDMTASNKLTVAIGEHMETDSSGRVDPMLANTAQAGIVQVGSGIAVSNGTISVPKATTSTAGSVQIGNGLNVANGVVSVPKATTSQPGIVQIGDGISVNNGVISVSSSIEFKEYTKHSLVLGKSVKVYICEELKLCLITLNTGTVISSVASTGYTNTRIMQVNGLPVPEYNNFGTVLTTSNVNNTGFAIASFYITSSGVLNSNGYNLFGKITTSSEREFVGQMLYHYVN